MWSTESFLILGNIPVLYRLLISIAIYSYITFVKRSTLMLIISGPCETGTYKDNTMITCQVCADGMTSNVDKTACVVTDGTIIYFFFLN